MGIEFMIMSIVGIVILFILERVYRETLDLKRQTSNLRRRIRSLEERLKTATAVMKKQGGGKVGSDTEKKDAILTSPNKLKQDLGMIKCSGCGRYYDSKLDKCPYCSHINTIYFNSE